MIYVADKNCTACALFTQCRTVCLSERIDEKAEMMMVFDYPSKADDKASTVMASGREKMLFDIAEKVVGIDLRKLAAKSYLVRCTPESRKPEPEEFDACFDYFIKEVELLKPKVILAIGDSVFQRLVPGKNKFMSSVGQAVKVTFGEHETLVVPTFSPYFVANNTSRLTDFATHIQKAHHISVGFAGNGKNTPYELCDTLEKVEQLMDYCQQTGRASFDFETTGLDVHAPQFRATCLSISFQPGSSYVVPLDHFETPFEGDEDMGAVLSILQERFFSNPDIEKTAHNLKYDMHVARCYGLWPIKGRLDDTMLMHHLIDETTKHGLKLIAPAYYPEYQDYEASVAAYGWDVVPLDILAQYSANDTDLTLKLRDVFENILLSDIRLYRIYRNLTMPALRVLQEMEYSGAYIDSKKLDSFIVEAEKIASEIHDNIMAIPTVARYLEYVRQDKKNELIALIDDKLVAENSKQKPRTSIIEKLTQQKNNLKAGVEVVDHNFNIGSWQQLQPLLYSTRGFGFPRKAKPKNGETDMPTDKKYLMRLDDDTGFITELLAWRSVNKILGTYLRGIRDRLDSNSKVHTSFLQHGTVTGRLSSADPNLQNIPKVAKVRHEKAKKVTKMVTQCFVPPAGWELVQIDYSQAELRLMAEFSEDQNMIEAYANDRDLHALTASVLLDKTLEDFYKLPEAEIKDGRTKAKAGNFGLIYGMSPEGFVEYARDNYGVIMSLEESMRFRQKFFSLYPNILSYHELYKAKAQKYGYVRTMFGRKRHCDDINSKDDFKRGMAEREAVNSPIQGTAGEMTVFALSRIAPRLRAAGLINYAILFNTVHDSILLYVHPDYVAQVSRIVKETCENLPIFAAFKKELEHVTMKVDFEKSSESWADISSYEVEK